MEEFQKYFFLPYVLDLICRPVGAKILSWFQFEGKTDVWSSQVRRVNEDPVRCAKKVGSY